MITVKERIPAEPADGSILDIVTSDVNYLTHGFHKYPAKFIPQLPCWAIEKYLPAGREGIVLDPFSGSGTTLVEALLAGRDAAGTDIDPLSVLISKVKTTPVDDDSLGKVSAWVVDRLSAGARGAFVPQADGLGHWFTADAVRKLSAIRSVIDEAAENFGSLPAVKDVYDLLIVCFSSIIRRVSNADDQSQKTYVSHTRPKVPEEALAAFRTQLNYFRRRMYDFSRALPAGVSARAINASALDAPGELQGGKIGLVVTSPPYIKAIDYVYNQMVELFWIGDLFGMQTQPLQNQRKKLYIGNKLFSKKEYASFDPADSPTGIPQADEVLRTVYETDPRNGLVHAFVTREYFDRMERHFSAVCESLDPGTPYVMVVGDSRVSGVHVPTSSILGELAARHGMRLVCKWGYRIKNRYMRFDRKGRGGIIDIDWVMEMVKE